jgi:photosystem II stability/assembly factor-like uncharacterized protein
MEHAFAMRRSGNVAHYDGDSVLLAVGTRNGLYVLESDRERSAWHQRGPYLTGMDVSHAILDGRDGCTLYAAANGDGSAAVYRSDDRGHTWQMAGESFSADLVWHVEPAGNDTPDVVYAGVMPAALYRSPDRGGTWSEMTGLTSHQTHSEWQGGGGGLCLHTIVTFPDKPQHLAVGISAVGWFISEDGGESWEPRNNGLNSFVEIFAEEMGISLQHREIHNCVHKAVRHPSNGLVYQQNHDGVYKTENGGKEWIDISHGLPNRFGFVIGVTIDGSVFVVPQHDWEEPIGVRMTGQLSVYRMRDDSGTWEALTNGLPEVSNVTLYREGMATDRWAPGGVYFGTSDGSLFATSDGGDSWRAIAQGLPSIRSVSCEHLSG